MYIYIPIILCISFIWQPITQECSQHNSGMIVMECESAGLLSQTYELNKPIIIEANVSGKPAENSTTDLFWAGLALNSDVVADDQYAQLAITKGIAPFTGWKNVWVVQLTGSGDPWKHNLFQTHAGVVHHLKIHYFNGVAGYYIDGVLYQTVKVDLGDNASVELLCVAVDPSTHIEGSQAYCKFSGVRVYYE